MDLEPTPRLSRFFMRPLIRLLHIYHRLSRPMTLGVRAAVFDDQGRIFLVRHSYVPGWHMPGGGVELGETLLDALAKELREEGNIELQALPPLHGLFLNTQGTKRDHVAVFVVRAFQQTGPRLPDWEIRESGFFAQDALPQGTSRATLARLAEISGQQPASPYW